MNQDMSEIEHQTRRDIVKEFFKDEIWSDSLSKEALCRLSKIVKLHEEEIHKMAKMTILDQWEYELFEGLKKHFEDNGGLLTGFDDEQFIPGERFYFWIKDRLQHFLKLAEEEYARYVDPTK